MSAMPDQLSVERHRDLTGRRSHPWVKRAVIAACAGFLAVALAGAIGQPDRAAEAAGAAARLRVTGPAVLRGGLMWRVRIELRARTAIKLPRLVLGPGFIDGMQLNSVEPSPQSEAGRDGRIVLSYDALKPGERLVVWIQLQVDPTTVGRQDASIELDDGARPLARLARTIRVLP